MLAAAHEYIFHIECGRQVNAKKTDKMPMCNVLPVFGDIYFEIMPELMNEWRKAQDAQIVFMASKACGIRSYLTSIYSHVVSLEWGCTHPLHYYDAETKCIGVKHTTHGKIVIFLGYKFRARGARVLSA